MVRGGAERVIFLLANHYAGLGWDTTIILLLKNEVDREQYSFNEKIKFVDLSGKKNNYVLNTFSWIFRIRNYLKKEKPDCVISFIGRINALVLTALYGLKIPILVSERSDPKRDGRSKLMQEYCSKIYKRADKVVFQTNYAKKCFPSLPQEMSIVIPNPVSVNYNPAISKNPYLIVTAGRLNKVKNHEQLIRAMCKVIIECPKARCKIYGSGEEKEYLLKLIDNLNLKQFVSLEGNKNDIGPFLSESSIFVLTSNYEGLPNAMIEAMMCENACISTCYSGVEDIIINEANGIIVPINDNDKLAKAIIDLLNDTTKRKEISKKANELSKEYEAKKVLLEWDRIIKEIIHDK